MAAASKVCCSRPVLAQSSSGSNILKSSDTRMLLLRYSILLAIGMVLGTSRAGEAQEP